MLSAGIYVAWRRLNVNKFMLLVVCLFCLKITGKLILSSIYLCGFDDEFL